MMRLEKLRELADGLGNRLNEERKKLAVQQYFFDLAEERYEKAKKELRHRERKALERKEKRKRA